MDGPFTMPQSNVTPPTRLVLALHNHQPVGNFDDVFATNLRDAYAPMLAALEEFPSLRVVMHTSGPLLDWLQENAAEYVERLRHAASVGQVEILGGPMTEPVLAAIPRRDRIGQIRAYNDRLERLFGVRPRGMWVPERVWEPSFTGDVTAAGVQYTLLDDAQFVAAGVDPNSIGDSYLCEDEGRLLRVFPIRERLRYLIPFAPVDDVFTHLRAAHDERPGRLMLFADDGEKFGGWPGTRDSVHREGWLREFLSRLVAEVSWVETSTLEEAVAAEPAAGLIALPEGSYREMTEWVLPPSAQRTLRSLRGTDEQAPQVDETTRRFLRGGVWRNFQTKYPEAGDMAARMKELSARVEAARRRGADADAIARATHHLYRGQCNCPYWHGSFGGLYLPHLRQAVYAALIACERELAALEGRVDDLTMVSHDLNLDGRAEVRIGSRRLLASLAPASGGHLYELDLLEAGVNLSATLDRREEPYHDRLRRDDDQLETKRDDLDEYLRLDRWRRRSLVDHFLAPDATLDTFLSGDATDGRAAAAEFSAACERSADAVCCRMSADVDRPFGRVRIDKSVTVGAARPGELVIRYELSGLPADADFPFAVEFNVAGLAPAADDRYFYSPSGDKLGTLDRELDLAGLDRLGLCDEYLGVDVSLDLSKDADLWAAPLRTVSGSEGGIELVYQQTCVVPRWTVTPDDDGRWSVEIRYSCDATAATARGLAELAVG